MVSKRGSAVGRSVRVSKRVSAVISVRLRLGCVQETRREDGKPYPSRSLKQLLCGLKRVMDPNRLPFNMFDRSNLDFNS